LYNYLRQSINKYRKRARIRKYLGRGGVPWSPGYHEFKWMSIEAELNRTGFEEKWLKKGLPEGYGKGLDERIVEYPWVFSRLDSDCCRMLDAGSTFNFPIILEHPKIAKKDLLIFTLAPEPSSIKKVGVKYAYGDLRRMSFSDGSFDQVVSISTLEHVGMNNSMYGEDNKNLSQNASSDYLIALNEMIRVLRPEGKLFLTFPYGKYEDHGFFQQFDLRMTDRLLEKLGKPGNYQIDFFKYSPKGWNFSKREDCNMLVSYNPHTGKEKMDDGAAHCRGVACIYFTKGK